MKRFAITILIASTLIGGTGCLQTLRDWRDWVKDIPKPPIENGDNGNDTNGIPDNIDSLPAGTRWIYGADISGWPKTINLTSATIHYGADKVTVTYDRLQEIPPWYVPGDPNNVHNVNGSIWLVREFQGQWYIGTFEYLRVGQQTKEFLTYAPQYRFEPQVGDRIGFMVSTTARNEPGTVVTGDPDSPYQERSNILWMEFGDP